VSVQSGQLRSAEAAALVIVDHADGLHPGVNENGAYELEAPRFESLGDPLQIRLFY
jgi:hypothetical protein